eukprot:scaffold84286_cov63-Phaeocystis_antarctica.AAC.1
MPSRLSQSSAGSAPLSSAEARVAQPVSVIWVERRMSLLSIVSTTIGGDSAPVVGDGTTRAARPSSPSGLYERRRLSSAGSRRKASARATSAASPMPALVRLRSLSRGMAPRPRAAASAEAPASPTCIPSVANRVTAGSAPAPSPSASRCTPSGPAELSTRLSIWSAGSTEPSVPNNSRSAAERPLKTESTDFASRSSLQLRSPTLRQNAVAASWSALSCCSSACVAVRSSLLMVLKATAWRGSSTLHSWTKRMRCSSPLSFDSAIAARARARDVGVIR